MTTQPMSDFSQLFDDDRWLEEQLGLPVTAESSGKQAGTKRPAQEEAQRSDAQRRWQDRRKLQAKDLEAELQLKVAQYEQLQHENSALHRKLDILESVLTVRERHVRALSNAAAILPAGGDHLKGPSSLRQASAIAAGHQAHACQTSGPGSEQCDEPWGGTACAPTACQAERPQAPSDTGGEGPTRGLSGLQPGQRSGAGMLGCVANAAAATAGLAAPSDAAHAAGPPCSSAPPAASSPITSIRSIAPVTQWDAAWIARLKLVTPREWQAMWLEFVRESSMWALAAEAHGPQSHAYQQLSEVVSLHLGVLDQITLIQPDVYYGSLYVNMATGQQEQPPPTHWRAVAKAVMTSPQQIKQCAAALALFDSSVSGVLQERTALAQQLQQALPPAPLASSAAPAPSGQHLARLHDAPRVRGDRPLHQPQPQYAHGQPVQPVPGQPWGRLWEPNIAPAPQQEQQQQQQPLLHATLPGLPPQAPGPPQAAEGAAAEATHARLQAPPLPTLAAAAGGPGVGLGCAPGYAEEPQGSGRGAALSQSLAASLDVDALALAELAEQLQRNVYKEHAAHNLVSDFLVTRVLTVLQVAKAAAASYPWVPDVTAILREGVLIAQEQAP